MKIVWRDVLNGWRNNLFPPEHLKELIKETQDHRLDICRDCPSNSSSGVVNTFSYCTDCGCPLKSKSACLHCECPQLKWLKQLTKEEEEEINKNQ